MYLEFITGIIATCSYFAVTVLIIKFISIARFMNSSFSICRYLNNLFDEEFYNILWSVLKMLIVWLSY